MNEQNSGSKFGIIGILVSVIIGAITLYFGTTNPEIGVVYIGLTYIVIVLYFITDFIVSKVKKKFDQIDDNTQKINSIESGIEEIKKNMNLYSEIANIKAKVETMEKNPKRKKGSIDPRIVIIIILLIVFYFYLRTLRILP